MNISLHPLVVMNVSDHFTRVKVRSQVPPVISGISMQNGRQRKAIYRVLPSLHYANALDSPIKKTALWRRVLR